MSLPSSPSSRLMRMMSSSVPGARARETEVVIISNPVVQTAGCTSVAGVFAPAGVSAAGGATAAGAAHGAPSPLRSPSSVFDKEAMFALRHGQRGAVKDKSHALAVERGKLLDELNDVMNALYYKPDKMGGGSESSGARYIADAISNGDLKRKMPLHSAAAEAVGAATVSNLLASPRSSASRSLAAAAAAAAGSSPPVTAAAGCAAYLGTAPNVGCWENDGERLIPARDIIKEALARLFAEGPEKEMWDVGQQVMPKQTREFVHPWASLILFMDAVLCGCCTVRFFRKPQVIRERIAYCNEGTPHPISTCSLGLAKDDAQAKVLAQAKLTASKKGVGTTAVLPAGLVPSIDEKGNLVISGRIESAEDKSNTERWIREVFFGASATNTDPVIRPLKVKGGLVLQTLFPSEPSSSLDYVGHAYKVAVSRTRLRVVAFFAVFCGIFAFFSIFAHILAPPDTTDVTHRIFSDTIFIIGKMLTTIKDEKKPWLASSLVGAYVVVLSLSILLMDVLDAASTTLRYYNVTEKDLPVILPLVLKPRVPFAMVSYTWGNDGEGNFARSLASVLPMCWVDVQMLSIGSSVPKVTAHVAASCHLLIITLSAKYLSSRNCILELVAAILRRKEDQLLWILDIGDAPEPLLRWLEERVRGTRVFRNRVARDEEEKRQKQRLHDAGLPVIVDETAQCCINQSEHELGVQELLCRAGSHVYRAHGPLEKARIMNWYRRFSDPVIQPQRGIRITPSIALAKPFYGDGGLCKFDRCFRPKGSLYVGSRYLSRDGILLGTRFCCTRQQFSLARLFVYLVVANVLFWVAWPSPGDYGFNNDQFLTGVAFNVTINICCLLATAAVAAIAANVNVNRAISPVFLPITIASLFGSSDESKKAVKLSSNPLATSKMTSSGVGEVVVPLTVTPSKRLRLSRPSLTIFSETSSSSAAAIHFNIQFLVTPPGAGKRASGSTHVSDFINRSLPNLVKLLRESIGISVSLHDVGSLNCSAPNVAPIGLVAADADYFPAAGDPIATEARDSASKFDSLDILVIVIRSKEAALQWLEHFRSVSPSHTILIVDYNEWVGHDVVFVDDDGMRRSMSDYLYLSLESIPMNELLPRLVDSLSSKVGAAMRIEPFPDERDDVPAAVAKVTVEASRPAQRGALNRTTLPAHVEVNEDGEHDEQTSITA